MKVKKIGNRFFLVAALLTSYSFLSAAVELVITDMNGARVTKVSTGVPFQAQVIVRDVAGNFSAPELSGINSFARGSVSSSTQITLINGQQSSQRRFSFVLRADHPGMYTVGPARISSQGATLESNEAKLEVATMAQTSSDAVQDQPAVLMVEVNKKKVVVGEPIEVTITLLHEPQARLASPLFFDVEKEGFEMGKKPSPFTGHRLVNGKTYACIEQKIELFPLAPGIHTIPVINAQCQTPTRRNSHSRFDFDDFFGRRVETYSAYSAPVTIEVVPLPSAQTKSQIVGEFRNFSAHIESDKTQVGEGLVLRLGVEGTGNEKKASFPTLQLPEGLTSYESKADVEDQGTSWKKTFEYIVQGVRPGNYTIPAQEFTYFDLKTRAYKTLKTKELYLAVKGGGANHNVAKPKKLDEQEPTISEKGSKENVEALPLIQEQQSTLDAVPKIPMSYFYYFRYLLIFLMLGIPRLLKWRAGSPEKQAFARARSLLKKYKQQNDTTKLYQLMMTLFAQTNAQSSAEVNEQAIVERLRSDGATPEMIELWNRDLALLAEASFYNRKGDNKHLFEVVDHWLNELEKIL